MNATTPDLVSKTIQFAKEKNIRLVVKNTGHDILGRSTGYGSLSVWIHHLRAGIEFHDSYDGGNCSASDWRGAAFTVGGGYTWEDVYPLAAARNLVVVGGGTPVRCIEANFSYGTYSPFNFKPQE